MFLGINGPHISYDKIPQQTAEKHDSNKRTFNKLNHQTVSNDGIEPELKRQKLGEIEAPSDSTDGITEANSSETQDVGLCEQTCQHIEAWKHNFNFEEKSDDDVLNITLDQFQIGMKSLKRCSNFEERIGKLWRSMSQEKSIENISKSLLGRICWIRDNINPNKSALLRVYKGDFDSTALNVTAMPEELRQVPWYHFHLVEYIYDQENDSGRLNNDPNAHLLNMCISPDGRFSGISWIRKGQNYSGSEIKDAFAMKISHYLQVNKEFLSDDASLPSTNQQTKYKMRLIFPFLLDSSMTWYERNGYLAMNCENIQLDSENEALYVTQDSVLHYQTLEKIRSTLVSTLYSEIFRGNSYHQKTILTAYRQLKPRVKVEVLLNDQKTNFSELITFVWKKRAASAAVAYLFHNIYVDLIELIQRDDYSLSKNQSWQEWSNMLSLIKYNELFVRNPCSSKKRWTAHRNRLLETIDTPEAQEELRQLTAI